MAETDTPNWLNNSFLETALKSGEYGPNVTVTSSEVRRATAAGDNYASDIYRATVRVTLEGRGKTLSLIVKSQPAKEEIAKIVSESNMFNREAGAFITLMPAVYRLLDEASPGEFQPCTASCLYYHSGSPASAIVLDDLKEQGFRMADRTVGLDMQHCLLVMKALAQSHAASAVLDLKNPEIFKSYFESFFCERLRKNFEPFFRCNMHNVAKEVEKWPLYSNRFASKLHRLADIVIDVMIKETERTDDDFNVLIHGDLWLNNMMFRYSDETEEVVDVRFVDYQLCHFTNAAQDLQYFLHTSPSINLLEKHSILVEEYHKNLQATLTLLGHEYLCPSLKKLYKQLDKMGRFAVVISCTVLPIVLADKNNIPDVDRMLKKEESVHFSDKYKDVFKTLLPSFEQKGWLDL